MFHGGQQKGLKKRLYSFIYSLSVVDVYRMVALRPWRLQRPTLAGFCQCKAISR